jgi:NADPH-dependent curcumin reductase CurA
MIIAMRIRMQGFIVFDYEKQYPEARKELAQWLSEGKLKRKETIVKGGLAKAEQALVDLYNGVNTGESLLYVRGDRRLTRKGKLLVEVAKPENVKANL